MSYLFYRLLIHQPLARRHLNRLLCALAVRDLAGIVTIVKLTQVPMQMKRRYMVMRPVNRPLQL